MPRPQPILARDTTAAAMLDMTPAEFRRLVDRGALPKPLRIGDMIRWDMDQIRRIVSGDAADDEFVP